MSAMASQTTIVSMVCSTVCSDADQRKHQSPASLVFVRGIHHHNGPVSGNIFIWWRHHDETDSGCTTPFPISSWACMINLVHAELFLSNMKIYLNFLSFLNATSLNPSWETRNCVSNSLCHMDAESQTTQGAEASAAMISTHFSRNVSF